MHTETAVQMAGGHLKIGLTSWRRNIVHGRTRKAHDYLKRQNGCKRQSNAKRQNHLPRE